MTIEPNKVTALIGSSGCGKTTFLRSLNRMHELTPGARAEGSVQLDGNDIYAAGIDPVTVRRLVGMVFQAPNPFPTMSIAENVAAGLNLNQKGIKKSERAEVVEKALRGAAPLGRGQGPARQARLRPVRRPAAAPVHRPRDRGRARGAADGRALLGARPGRDARGRGPDRRAAQQVHDRDRHPQHAAGGEGERRHRVLQPRARAASPAAWWRWGRPRRSSPARTRRPQRTTSAAGSAEMAVARTEYHEELERLEEHALGGLDIVAAQLDRADRGGRAQRRRARGAHRRQRRRGRWPLPRGPPGDPHAARDPGAGRHRPAADRGPPARDQGARADGRPVREHRQGRFRSPATTRPPTTASSGTS